MGAPRTLFVVYLALIASGLVLAILVGAIGR